MPFYYATDGMQPVYYGGLFGLHESSWLHESAKVGVGTKIWHFCHISRDVVIGENCKIGQNCYIGPGVIIGNNVKIQNNVSVYEGVTIEDDVFIGPSVVFTNVLVPRSGVIAVSYAKTLIRKGASIGANATIICGNVIGNNSFVGAGSVVTKSVLPHTLVYGNPARIRKRISASGNTSEI